MTRRNGDFLGVFVPGAVSPGAVVPGAVGPGDRWARGWLAACCVLGHQCPGGSAGGVLGLERRDQQLPKVGHPLLVPSVNQLAVTTCQSRAVRRRSTVEKEERLEQHEQSPPVRVEP